MNGHMEKLIKKINYLEKENFKGKVKFDIYLENGEIKNLKIITREKL